MSGNQGDEWQLVQIHVTLQSVHQVILEATVGGKAGDIAIDDISLTDGPCSASGNRPYIHQPPILVMDPPSTNVCVML